MTEPTTIAVKREGEFIVLKFSRNVDYIEMAEQNAKDIACAITDAAFEGGVKPANDSIKAALTERHFHVLVPRLTLVLNTLREKKRLSNGQLAMKVVEVCLNEIFT
jgi:hypothetical protein